MNTPKYLVHSFRKLMLIGLLLLAICSAIIFSIVEYFNYQQKVESLRHDYIEKQEALLKRDVGHAIDVIRYERKYERQLLDNELNRTSFLAKDIVSNYLAKHRPRHLDQSLSTIAKMLEKFLFSLPDDQLILFDEMGRIIHQKNFSFITQANLKDFRNSENISFFDKVSLFKDSELPGILDYSLPTTDNTHSQLILSISYFPTLKLFLCHGKNEANFTSKLQQVILDKLSYLRQVRNGDLFIGNYQGVSLLGPVVGSNMIEVQDASGVFVVKELIKIAKKGKGFFRYRMPRQVNLNQLEKLSYVEGINEWGWYVGAGTYLDEIIQMVKEGRIELVERSFRHIFLIGAFYLFVLFIFFTLSDEIAVSIRNQIDRFRSDFKRAEEGVGIISRDGIEFAELDQIAESANRMIEARLKIELQSEEKSSELERLNAELKIKTKEAVQATEAKARFLANMSHEIRTPLNAIIGMGDVLYDSPLSSQQKEYLGILKRSSEHLLILINDILDFSKIESGKIVIDNELVDFVALCEDALGLVSSRFPQVVFSLDYQENLNPYVHSDPFRMRQILLNLLSNAGKATPQGEVSLRVRADQFHLFVDIIDTGVGIEKKHLDIIFDLFSQIDGSFDKKYEGTGLGLAISRSLAQLLGGEITVTSQVGSGSVFTLVLPVMIVDQNPAKDRYHAILKDKKVNIFSPYQLELDNLSRLFTRLGAQVNCWDKLVPDFFRHAHQLFIGFGPNDLSSDIQDLIRDCPLPIVWSAGPGQNVQSVDYLPLFNMLSRPIHLSALFNFFLRVEGNLNELRYNPIDFLIIDQDLSYGRVLEKQVLGSFARHTYYANSMEQALELLKKNHYGLVLVGDSVCSSFREYSQFVAQLADLYGDQDLCLMLNSELEEALPAPLNRLQSFNKLSSRDYIFQLFYGVLSFRLHGGERAVASASEIHRKVLVVDDNASNLLLVQVMLKGMPIEVVMAGSGKEALAINEQQGPFDLILMDIQMPEMDGMTAIKMIRNQEREKDIWPVTIFALTAYALKEEHEKIMASGCNGILTKPIQKHVLCDFMREFYRLPAKS